MGKWEACLWLSTFSTARRGGGNVGIAPRDFQGRWEAMGNLLLVFLAFHGPAFPRPFSGAPLLLESRKQMLLRPLHFFSRLSVTLLVGLALESHQRYVIFQVAGQVR